MPRRPRVEFPGGLYHVTNRGVEQRQIARDDTDRTTWFRLLNRTVKRHDWRVFAYALLGNHFHLYFRLSRANLSSGMQDFEGGYASEFNKRHARVGPLFQGRFKAVLVENDSHSWELTRYVHLNAVRAGVVDDPFKYRWSSYRYYLNPRGAPSWLDWKTVLAQFGGTEAAARLAYKRFVAAGLANPPANPLDGAADGWILGSEEFADGIREQIGHDTTSDGMPQDAPAPEDVVSVVSRMFAVPPGEIYGRGRQGNWAREAAMLLVRELSAEPADVVGEAFGGIGVSAVSETVRRARRRAAQNDVFREQVEKVRRALT